MSSLLCFVLAVLASPFKSKARLEAENAVLRHQLIVFARAQGSMANATQSAMHLLSADGARPLGSREHILLKVNPPPRTVIVFVNPKFGTPVMKRTPIAFYVPPKALIWQRDDGGNEVAGMLD
jgi:uncharacterized protein DUF302